MGRASFLNLKKDSYYYAPFKRFLFTVFLLCLLIKPEPLFASFSFWNSCLKIATQIGLLDRKKIINQALAKILPKKTPKDLAFTASLENVNSLPTQQLQENLARLKDLRKTSQLTASEKAAFDNLIMKMDIESTARTKVSADSITKLNLNRPLSLDRTVGGKNAMIEDLNSLIEARKNPLLTKQDKEKISDRIKKLLDSPHEDNPKLAAENNYYFEEFLSKQKNNLEPAELGKALNRKTTHADIAERQSFDAAEKAAYPDGFNHGDNGRFIVDSIMSRTGESLDPSAPNPKYTRTDLKNAATYVDNLIESERKSPTPGVNPKHLNQMRSNLESLAQGQGTSLDNILKSSKHRQSLISKFPDQQITINNIFDEIDIRGEIPLSLDDQEEFANTIKSLRDSQKLSPSEDDLLKSYFEKFPASLKKESSASSGAKIPPSIQQTQSPTSTALSIAGRSKQVNETKFQSKLKDLANALDDKSLKPEDITAIKKEIRNNLNSALAPEKFENVDGADNLRGNRLDEIENLAKIREKVKDDPDLKNEISQRIKNLLSEPIPVEKLREELRELRKDLRIKAWFPDAANTYSSAKISGLSEEEIKLLNLRKSEYEKLQNEFNQFADYTRPTLPTSDRSIGPARNLNPLRELPVLPAGDSRGIGSLPASQNNLALPAPSNNRPLTPEEFQRMANGGLDPNDPLIRAAAQHAVEAEKARAAQQAVNDITAPPASVPNQNPSTKSKTPYVVAGVGAAALAAYVNHNKQVDNAPPHEESPELKTQTTATESGVTLATNRPPSTPVATPPAPTPTPSHPTTDPTVITVPAPANTDGQLPQDPGTSKPGQPGVSPQPSTGVPEEPEAPTPLSPSGSPSPAPTPAPSTQPSPSPSPSSTPSAPHNNDGTYLPPPPYSAPSSAPSNYSGPPAKKESGVSKFFSAIGNFFSSILKAILSIFGAK